MLKQIQGAGWRQCEPPEDRSSIKEEEVRALFNMIDKDGSGELTKRVGVEKIYHVVLVPSKINIADKCIMQSLGNKESS